MDPVLDAHEWALIRMCLVGCAAAIRRQVSPGYTDTASGLAADARAFCADQITAVLKKMAECDK